MNASSNLENDGGAKTTPEPTATPDGTPSASPVIGGRRSLREIPQTEKLKGTAHEPSGAPLDDALLEKLRRQPSHCRELIRKHLHGLAKRQAKGGAATPDASELCRHGLNDGQYGLLQRFSAEVSNGNVGLLRRAWLVDYVDVPPTIMEFIRDPRFLGNVYGGEEESDGLYPVWKEALDLDFDLDSEMHNVVLTGALGIGKTTILVLIILFRLCLTTMLRDPQKFFGAGRVSRLIFALLSVTKAVVRDTAFHEALNLMRTSPYFVETCGVNSNAEYAECRVEMKRRLPDGRLCNVFLTAGSRHQDLLGRNVLGVALDEGNFRLEKDPDRSAYELYSAAISRMANRFQRTLGYRPTISIIASSAGNEWSFSETVIKEIADAKTPRARKVYRFAAYDVKRHMLDLDGVNFRVAYGVPNCDPVVLSGYCKSDGTSIGSEPLESTPPGARIEIVPRMYEEEYRRNCRAALQDYSGISIGGTHRAFPEMHHFHDCIKRGEQEGLREPTRPGVTKIPLSMEDDREIRDHLIRERFFTRQSSSPLPIRHPNSKRYVHIDLATRTTAGIAVCHLVGGASAKGQGGNYQLIVEYDFILALGPGRNPPIYLQKIVNFLFWLRDDCGFRFGRITADSYQSDMLLQTLQGQGLETGHLSVDRDKSVYEAWRNGIEGHQIRLYRHELLLREAEFLQELERKFDHPVGGSKDLADAAAGAYFNAITSPEKSMLSTQNEPAVYGVGLAPIRYDAALTDFGIFEDYMRRNPRPIRQFNC